MGARVGVGARCTSLPGEWTRAPACVHVPHHCRGHACVCARVRACVCACVCAWLAACLAAAHVWACKRRSAGSDAVGANNGQAHGSCVPASRDVRPWKPTATPLGRAYSKHERSPTQDAPLTCTHPPRLQFKWGISIANVADLQRPPEKVSYPQQLGGCGCGWARWVRVWVGHLVHF